MVHMTYATHIAHDTRSTWHTWYDTHDASEGSDKLSQTWWCTPWIDEWYPPYLRLRVEGWGFRVEDSGFRTWCGKYLGGVRRIGLLGRHMYGGAWGARGHGGASARGHRPEFRPRPLSRHALPFWFLCIYIYMYIYVDIYLYVYIYIWYIRVFKSIYFFKENIFPQFFTRHISFFI